MQTRFRYYLTSLLLIAMISAVFFTPGTARAAHSVTARKADAVPTTDAASGADTPPAADSADTLLISEEAAVPTPLPAAEQDSAFEQLDELFPALYLLEADEESVRETESALPSNVAEFLSDWFDELLATSNKLRVTLTRIGQYYPDEYEEARLVCETYISAIMELRTEAYRLGSLDRGTFLSGNDSLDALQEEFEQTAELLEPLKELAESSTRSCRARLRHSLYYLTEYAEDSRTLLAYYELGRYLGLSAEEAKAVTPSLAELFCAQAIGEAEAVDDPYLTSRNKYNSYFGDSGSPWCAYFVVYNAIQAGVPDSVIPHTNNRKEGYICVGGCASLRSYMLKYCSASWHSFDSDYTPVPGDIIYYGSGTSLGSICHVGLVLGTEGDYQAAKSSGEKVQIRTAEGNTSWEEHKSNCVRIKVREAAASNGRVGSGFYVLGYLTPDYAGAEASAVAFR